MDHSLFLGNGLNRSIVSEIEWGNLLKSIATEYEIDYMQDIPFPILFENMANIIQKKRHTTTVDIYSELKMKIASQIETVLLPDEAPHFSFAQLPVRRIITSNYDYGIEKCLEPTFDYHNDSVNLGSTKYNLQVKRSFAGKDVCPVHGEIKKIKSICLGYEHYAGTLQNMREALNTKSKKTNERVIKEYLSGIQSSDIWPISFFTDNIDIVGFGLSQCEIDMWWLLTYRAYLFYTDQDNLRCFINNTITYHDIGTTENERLKYALENVHVRYKFHMISAYSNEEYRLKYSEIAMDLLNDMN